jgi:hypothetical protein
LSAADLVCSAASACVMVSIVSSVFDSLDLPGKVARAAIAAPLRISVRRDSAGAEIDFRVVILPFLSGVVPSSS